MKTSATIDPTGQYRYSLTREWDSAGPRILFIMLNGSTADAEKDDPTIRRCIGFAKRWGYGSLEVVNLFGYRTTLPTELKKALDPIGPDNDQYITAAAKRARRIIIAWGAHGAFKGRGKKVLGMLCRYGCKIECLGETKDGHPRHPLYIRNDTEPELYGGGIA